MLLKTMRSAVRPFSKFERLFRFAQDEDLLAGMNELQPLANFEFLLRWIVAEPLDVLPLALDFLRQDGVTLLQLFDLPLLIEQGSDAARAAQRKKSIADYHHKCDEVCKPDD